MEEEIKEGDVQEQEVKEEKQKEPEKPLDKMTATELREIAVEIPGIEGAHAMKKEQLLMAIKEARGIKEEEPAKKKRTKGARKDVDLRELKKKIADLKMEKESVRTEKDRKKIAVLRRRINRLKKRTRKAAALG